MIKFRSEDDKLAFLVESGNLELLNVNTDDWPENLSEIFFKKQRERATNIVDFRKSQLTKRQWRQDKWKMMTGINKFHRSVKGKKFHRSLGRFLATRIFEPSRVSSLVSLRAESLKAITSLRTHLYIESEFYMPLEEAANFMVLYEHAVPALAEIETKVYKGLVDEINADEVELLLRLVESKEVKKACIALGADQALIEAYSAACESENTDDLYFFTESLGFTTNVTD